MAPSLSELLAAGSIQLDTSASSRDDAIRAAGQALVDARAVEPSYIEAMIDRENSVSTFMGEGVAIPHGTLASMDLVRSDALSLIRFTGGVDWDGNDVRLVIGLAAKRGAHIALLAQLANVLMVPANVRALRTATDVEQIYALLGAYDV